MSEKVEKRSVSVRIDGKDVENSLKGIQRATNQLYNEVAKLERGTDQYKSKLQQLNIARAYLADHKKEVQGVQSAWNANTAALKSIGAITAGVFAVDAVIQYGREIYKTGVELDNIARKSAIVLKDQLAAVNQEAAKNAQEIGLAREQYVGLATDVTAFLQSQKLSRTEAAKMSTEVVNLSGVLSQFQGGGLAKTQEALEAIKGAFAEDVEQLAKFNIAISENVIQAKMQQLGLDKANAAAQQHGRAMIILQMITEGATAQQEAFNGSSDGMVRSQARIEAMLQTIQNNLAKFFIPLIEKALGFVSPLVAGLAAFSEGMAALANPAKAATEAFTEQKNSVENLEKNIRPLLDQHDKLKSKSSLSAAEQKKLKDITVQIGEAVPTATTAFDNYGRALSVNTDIARTFIEVEKRRLEYMNQTAIQSTIAAKSQLEKERDAIKKILEKGERLDSNITGEVSVALDANDISQFTNQLSVLQRQIDGAQAQIDFLSGKSLDRKIPDAPIPGFGDKSKSQIDAEKRRREKEKKLLEDQQKLLDSLIKQRKEAGENLAVLDVAEIDKEIERARDKYNKLQEIATELGKSASLDIRTKAAEESQKIADMEAQEVEKISKKHLENQILMLEKFVSEKENNRRTDAQKELDAKLLAINLEYDALIAEQEKLEKSKVQRVAEAAAAAKKELEAQRDADIMRAVIDDPTEEDPDKSYQRRIEVREQYLTYINDSHTLELEQAEAMYMRLLALAEKFGGDQEAITRAYLERKAQIERDFQAQLIEAKREQVEAEIALELAKIGAMQEGAAIVRGLVGENTIFSQALFLFEKVLAIVSIRKNLALELSALNFAQSKEIATYAAIPGAGQFLQAAAIAKYTALKAKARVNAGINVATVAAQAVAPFITPLVKQKFLGGPVIGETDGKVYNPDFAGTARTGLVRKPTLFLTGEGNVPEYVIAGPELQLPGVPNFLAYIESKRKQRVSGFQNGGFTTENQIGSASNASGSSPLSMGSADLVSLFQRLYEVMDRGIVFTYEHMIEHEKMKSKLESFRG